MAPPAHATQVHADASNFASGVTKEQAYEQVLLQAEGLFDDQRNWPSLILGPFQGKVACQTIPFGRGVCGVAASTRETQLVPDVDAFPGHIACDGDSKSEVVVPVVVGGKLVAIIDVDCAEKDGFDEVDRLWLEKLATLLAKSCDW
ncbi:Free methionine-R-sulfoxide reductase [Colletotrichum chlorophyti]|uniref:Free methionine-R-sulfoxide reductase n=1 Tax=Colletotrichum chlorophyti TaxID=708187 RepID=A0A1Q8RNK4_9PEZI|nr:Free methionine-R-sulfoxide reductase [Colletotrichum chlorophyti]